MISLREEHLFHAGCGLHHALMTSPFVDCLLRMSWQNFILGEVLHYHEWRIALCNKTGGNASVRPAPLARFAMRNQDYQISLEFFDHIMQGTDRMIGDRDCTLNIQAFQRELGCDLLVIMCCDLLIFLCQLVDQLRVLL